MMTWRRAPPVPQLDAGSPLPHEVRRICSTRCAQRHPLSRWTTQGVYFTHRKCEKTRYLLNSGFFVACAVFLVGRGRLELPTNGLKVRCSTN